MSYRFQELVEQWCSDYLGPEKHEGVGLLWKYGGFSELLVELSRRAPRVLVALARELDELPEPDTRFSAFVKAWDTKGPRERRDALARTELGPPTGTLVDVLDALEPPMPGPFRARIETWLDSAEALERTFIAPPTLSQRRDLTTLRRHLGLTASIEIDPDARVVAEEDLSARLPSDALWLLAALGHTPHHPLGLLRDIEIYQEGMERAGWRKEQKFHHVPLAASGDHWYLCVDSRPLRPLYRTFDLRAGFIDEATKDVGVALRRFWPDAPWEQELLPDEPDRFRIVEPPARDNRVEHPKFGPGEVLEDRGDRVVVRFEDGQQRTLLKRFVGL